MIENVEAIQAHLIELVKELLKQSGESFERNIKIDDSLQRHLGIDSLGKAELFQRIEKHYEVTLPDRLLAEADSIRDIASYLVNAEARVSPADQQYLEVEHGERPNLQTASIQSLVDALLLYGEHYPNRPHVYFQNEDGHEEVITYGTLFTNAKKVAAGLKARGLAERDCVAIMQPTSPDFFYAFFGTLLAGGVPVPIYPPFRMHMLEAYAKTEARILNSAEVRMLITFKQAEKLSHIIKTFVPSLKHVVLVSELMNDGLIDTFYHPTAQGYGLIQYTSGSTSDPKGVLLTHGNLLANIRAYSQTIQATPEDTTVSWLPLYHDMGLIGAWLGSFYFGVPLVLMTPFTFLNHPEKWLWAIHHHRGTVSAAPNFAYELCIKKIDTAQLEGLDLSSWRLAANGAEKIYPRTLEQFVKKFEPFGFRRNALKPVYGLAESTVGLALPDMDRSFVIDRVDRKQFEEAELAVPVEKGDTLEFVACGKALPEHEIKIVSPLGETLPDRSVGSLYFRGPSMMQGYYNNPTATQAAFKNGWIDSGDLAYQVDGEVYITGRRKDLIVKAGRNLYPVEIEECVGAVPGVRLGCVAVFSVTDEDRGTEQLIVVAETKATDDGERQKISRAIGEAVAASLDIVPDHIVMVAPHMVPKTSSGKLQRAACKQLYLSGSLNRSKLPAWAQVAKLALESAFKQSRGWLTGIGKTFYTTYVAVLTTLLFIPSYVILLMSNQSVAASFCRIMTKVLLRLLFCPVKVKGAEQFTQIKSPVIYAANHASYLDAIVLMSVLPAGTLFVAKSELVNTPILRTFLRKLKYLPVDRVDQVKGVEDAGKIAEALKAGNSLVIFPEGTFGYAKGLRPFRLGAFKVAAECDIPVCPVSISGTRDIWRDGDRVIRPGEITVTVSETIKSEGKEWEQITAFRQQVRQVIAEHCGEPALDLISAQSIAPKHLV